MLKSVLSVHSDKRTGARCRDIAVAPTRRGCKGGQQALSRNEGLGGYDFEAGQADDPRALPT